MILIAFGLLYRQDVTSHYVVELSSFFGQPTYSGLPLFTLNVIAGTELYEVVMSNLVVDSYVLSYQLPSGKQRCRLIEKSSDLSKLPVLSADKESERRKRSAGGKSNTYLTTKQAAEYLGLSEKTLANWRCSGLGPHYRKFGRSVRYKKFDLIQWSKANKRLTTSQSGR